MQQNINASIHRHKQKLKMQSYYGILIFLIITKKMSPYFYASSSEETTQGSPAVSYNAWNEISYFLNVFKLVKPTYDAMLCLTTEFNDG